MALCGFPTPSPPPPSACNFLTAASTFSEVVRIFCTSSAKPASSGALGCVVGGAFNRRGNIGCRGNKGGALGSCCSCFDKGDTGVFTLEREDVGWLKQRQFFFKHVADVH